MSREDEIAGYAVLLLLSRFLWRQVVERAHRGEGGTTRGRKQWRGRECRCPESEMACKRAKRGLEVGSVRAVCSPSLSSSPSAFPFPNKSACAVLFSDRACLPLLSFPRSYSTFMICSRCASDTLSFVSLSLRLPLVPARLPVALPVRHCSMRRQGLDVFGRDPIRSNTFSISLFFLSFAVVVVVGSHFNEGG